MSKGLNMEYITLRNGVKLPKVGFGTYKVADPIEGKIAILNAIEAGYRLFDTAQVYHNEEVVGEALKESGLPRKDFFITTKIRFRDNHDPVPGLEESFKKLQTDYIDLVLIHWPYGDYLHAYKVLEDYYKQGKIKAIGVSNFDPGRLIDLVNQVEIPPMVNQIEANVYAQRHEEMKWYEKYGVIIQAHSPLGHGKTPQIFQEQILIDIGKKYNKSSAQVALRYLLDRGIAVVPKASNKAHMLDNFDILDFSLSKEDMEEIKKLDKMDPVIGRPEDPLSVEKMWSKDE